MLRISKGLIALILLLTLVPAQAATSKADTPTDRISKPLTVILDWFPNPNHAPLFVAQQQGYFKQQGLTVKLIGPADPNDPPKLVAAGKADIAITYQPAFLQDIDRGLPLVQFGTLIATPLSCMAVLSSSKIHHIKDLKGKSIGYSTSPMDSMTLMAMLKQAGLSKKDVQLINVHYNLTQALLTHKVDAIIGIDRNYEVLQMNMLKQPVRVFYPEELGVPSYSALIMVTNRNEITDPRLPRFIVALTEGVQYLVNYPEQAWQVFASNHPVLNTPLNKAAWFATLPRFALRPGIDDPHRIYQLEKYLQASGAINKIHPIKQIVKDGIN